MRTFRNLGVRKSRFVELLAQAYNNILDVGSCMIGKLLGIANAGHNFEYRRDEFQQINERIEHLLGVVQ